MIKPINSIPPKVGGVRGQYCKNPVNRRTEQNLALLNAGGISAVTGAVTTAIARSYTSTWKHAAGFGLGAAFVTMIFVAPRFLYKSGITSFTKAEEMDIFTKEKEVQKKLLTEVRDAIDEHNPQLNEKIESYSKTKNNA